MLKLALVKPRTVRRAGALAGVAAPHLWVSFWSFPRAALSPSSGPKSRRRSGARR